MKENLQFDSALYGLPPKIRRTLEFLPDNIKAKTEEIRLRAERAVSLTVTGKSLFVTRLGGVCDYISTDLLTADANDLHECFLLLCRHSVYAHEAELKNGYIQMSNGHRAGVCGTFTKHGELHDITSVNIRIARQVFGCADTLYKGYCGDGMLIAGPPCSGKTTLLRDFIRQLSNSGERIAVVDSRGELSGRGQNDLGNNTDVLFIENKAAGVEIALRTLFPNVIAFDELGTAAELSGISESFYAGVNVITTAHAGSARDLLSRSVTERLIKSGAVKQVALLSGKIGSSPQIFGTEDILREYGI